MRSTPRRLSEASSSARMLAGAPTFCGDRHAVVLVPAQSALGEHERPLGGGDLLQCRAHDLFGMPEPVDGGGVDPVDAALDRMADGGDRLLVVLAAPADRPVAAADGPGAEPDRRDVHVGAAEPPLRQRGLAGRRICVGEGHGTLLRYGAEGARENRGGQGGRRLVMA